MNGLQKAYAGAWIAFGIVIGVLLVSGNMTMLAISALGFVCFGMIFLGMICVLPTSVTHPGVPRTKTLAERWRFETLRTYLKSWLHPIAFKQQRQRHP